MNITTFVIGLSLHNWFFPFIQVQYGLYGGQGSIVYKVYLRNTEHEMGIHPGWHTSPPQGTMGFGPGILEL